MARQEAKPQGPREGGPAALGRRGRLRARGLNRAAGRAARFPGVRGSCAASQDAPPLLLGLLLLAALPEHCLADQGKDNQQIAVTPTPESSPHGRLLPISPTWPFSEVQSSSAVDRMKPGPGPSPDNTSWPQSAWTALPKTHRRARAHGDFSPPQDSARSASLEPSKDSTETLVQPRPPVGREAAAASGLPHARMPPPLPSLPPGTPFTAGLPLRPPRVGTPSISELHSPRADALLSSSSSALAPDSPHSIIFSKAAERPTKVPLFPHTAPTDSSSSQSIANPLNPFAEEMNHAPSRNAQDLIGIPHLGFSGASSPAGGPHSADSPAPEFLSSVADLAPLSPAPPASGSLLQLHGGRPSLLTLEVAPSLASTQPTEAEVAEGAHNGVSLPTLKSAATHEAASSLVQTAESVAVRMTSLEATCAPAKNSAYPLHVSATPENSKGPTLSAEHKSSPLVPSPLPLTTAGQGQQGPSGAVPTSPSNGTTAGFPSTPAPLQLAQSHVSPSAVPQVPTPQEAGGDGSPPTAAADLLLLSTFPHRPSMTWTFPLQKEGNMAAVLKKNEKANLTVALQTLLSKESLSLHAVGGFTSDFSTDHVSTDMTPPGTSLLPSELPPSSIPFARATQTVSPSRSFSRTKPVTYAAVTDHSELPVLASKQVTAFPSSSEVYDFSTMGGMRKPATTDVFWSSVAAEAESLSTEPMMSSWLQQTNYDVNGHTVNSTSWETHPAPATSPGGLNSTANTIKSQDFKDNVGHSVTVEGFSIQDPGSGLSTNQSIQQSDVTVGNHTDFLSINTNNYTRDVQTAEIGDYPHISQQAVSHPHLQSPAHPTHPLVLSSPSLTSTARLPEMLSDEVDTSFQIADDIYPSPVINASPPFQDILRFHSPAESPALSTSALFRTPSKAPWVSQHPEKWTGATTNAVDSSALPKAEPTAAAAATTLFLRKSSPLVLSAALVAKGTGSSPSAMASGLAKSSWTTALAKNITSSAASGPKATPGVAHPAFSFTPTYMFARTAHTMSTHTAMQGNTGATSGLLSTTHLPRKPQAMHTGFPNPTNPDLPRVSTTRPLTITAALTSITAPVRATRMPPSSAENTDAALPAVSTAVVTAGKTASNLECQMSSKLLVKTVLFLTQRRMQISETLKLNIAKGLTQALRKAFHQNDILAHVDLLEHSHNITVGYYATKGRLVYLPSAVSEMLGVYGISNVTADVKQHTPNLQSVAVLASPWIPQPAGYLQLKTVLQFVSQSDNIQSCKFAQTMEQRLQRAFQDAERKVLNTKSNLTVQMVSTSNASQTVTLVYVVANRSSFLNGTVASSLLRQLSAELVGFYLTYPPLTIAEPLEYPNLDISETTRDYWVITVLQGVDNSLVGLHNQSFARVMEQRLAQLFMMSQQQGRRFKRATTLGSYTVQMVKMQRVPGPKDPAELTYYTLYNGKPLLGTAAAKILSTIDSQRMALTLHHVVLLQADPVVKNPPNNLWIIAAVLAPIAVVTVIIIIITAVLCRKNKNDFKPDTMMNLPQRAKPVQGFDYAKQHLGQQGADEEVIPVTQETVVLPLPVRDAPASQERDAPQDGSTIKTAKSIETRKSRSPSENGSVISNESGKPSSGRRSPQNVMAQQKVTKEEARKRNVPASDEEEGAVLFDNSGKVAVDPFDTSSGSVHLIGIKPTALPVVHPASDRSQEPAVLNGEKKSKFKTFKKFFGKKKRKESSSSTGSSTWKQSQAKNEVMAIESGPVGYDSEDELEDSRGALGSRALSHDSIFIPESGQDPPRPVRVFSQENVCDRIKALQLKIQCNVKMGPPPPPGSLPTKRGDDAGMSSEDDGLPRSPPEMSLLHDIGSSTTIKVCVVSSSRPQSPDQLFSRQASETSASPRTSDSSMVPVADFDYPPEFSSCLDNSAAKHKLLVKPRNQRSSKMRRLSSRAQSESLSDLTCTPEEEEVDEKPPLQVSTEEQPSSGQQEAGQDGGSEPERPAPVLPPVGPRVRRARLQHCPALTASTEEESPPGENSSSRPATPEDTPQGTLEATLEVMEVTEPLSGRTPHSESPSRPEGSPDPNPNSENQREDLSSESACPPGGDTADEAVCASGDNVEGRLSPCVPEGDTTPPEPGPAATQETPPGLDGTDKAGQKEPLPALDLPTPEGAGPESPAAAPSPPPPKSCLKHKAPSPPASASEAPPQAPAPRSPEQGPAPRGPPKTERAGSPSGAAERKTERGGCEARGAAKKFSVSSGREWPRAGGRLLEPRGPAVRLPLLRSGPAWKSEAALDDLPAPPEPQGPKPGPRKPPTPAERGSPDTADPAAQERAAGGEGGPFPVKLRSTSLSFKHREAPCPEGKAIKRYSAEVRLERGGLSLLSRDDKGPPGSGPSTRGARPPSEPGKAKTLPTEQLSSKPPLPRKPLLQTLTLPQLPAPPDTSSGDPEKVGLPMDPRKESRAERRSPHRAVEKVAGPGTNSQPVPPWITVGRQKRRGPLEQPPSQEDKPAARTLKSDTGRPAKEPGKHADFVRSKSFLLAPAKPPADQRPGAKLRLQEGLQRGVSLSHQNLAAPSAVMMEKELHQLKRASYSSTDQPSWMELARKKSQAWSDMPQIIK